MCQKIILTHAQFRKKDECDTKLCDMIQDFDEQLKERMTLGLWLRLECSLDSLSIVSTDHQIDRGLSVSLRLYEMCHVLVIV